MRSWYLMKKSCATRGCRPMSYSTAPTSVYTFGSSSSSLPRRARSFACQPRCAATKVVFGWRRKRLSRSVRSCSNDGILVGRIAAVREERQLEPALVRVVDGLEELRRVGGVDEDRQLEPRARIPDRIELRIVELEPRAVGLLDGQPKALRELPDPDGSGGDVTLELRDRARAPPRADIAEVDPGEEAHAVLHRRRRVARARRRFAARRRSCRRPRP